MLPYGVNIRVNDGLHGSFNARLVQIYSEGDSSSIAIDCPPHFVYSVESVRPYLRPMSSMTDDEEREWIRQNSNEVGLFPHYPDALYWVLVNHLDIFELIPKGLAEIAPEGMYK